MMTYAERMRQLREKKIAHTLGKLDQQGYMDADDYGTVPFPEDYHFEPDLIDGGLFGYANCAANFARLVDGHPIYVDPLEILAGRWRDRLDRYRLGNRWPEHRFPYDHLKPGHQLYNIVPGFNNWAHCAPDYSIGLALGWEGLLGKVREGREAHGPAEREFYDAEETTVLAIQRYIRRHVDEIQRLSQTETDPGLQETLADMLACNEWVVDKPPRSFLEACQWIAWYAVVSRMYNRDGAGCQLDGILLPYYRRDRAEGVLTDEKATFILANLLLIDPHYYQVSGPDVDGNDTTNELSYLILDAGRMLNASCNVTVRYHDKIDSAFLTKAVTCLFDDRNGWPRFSGDKGLMGYTQNRGITREIARQRFAVGCNWMAVPGREYPLNDCVKINVAKVFEVAFDDMMAAGTPSLERLQALLETHLAEAIRVTADGINLHLDHQHEVFPELVMNLMMHHCLETGQNITQCAEILTMGVDGVALGTVADSLAALDQRIVREQATTFETVYAALKNNFAGTEGERLRLLLSTSERYCGGDTLGDHWAQWLSRLFTKLVVEHPMPGRRQMVPGWFSWSLSIQFGEKVGATPNGRKAGTPVTHGANPTPGFRRDGAVTAMAAGIAAIQPGRGNTAPLQLEFDPRISREQGGIDKITSVIRTHFDLGGTLININVLDKKTLMEAHENPLSHPDLVVRVTGFTAYFAALSPEFRQLVIDRFIDGL